MHLNFQFSKKNFVVSKFVSTNLIEALQKLFSGSELVDLSPFVHFCAQLISDILQTRNFSAKLRNKSVAYHFAALLDPLQLPPVGAQRIFHFVQVTKT